MVGMGGSIPRLVVFNVSYFVTDNFALEANVGGAPHYINIGAAANFHFKNSLPHSKFRLCYGKTFGGYHVRIDSIPPDSLVPAGGSFDFLEIGIGRDFAWGGEIGYFVLGPSIWFNSKKKYMNSLEEIITQKKEDRLFLGHLEVGAYRFPKRKDINKE